MLDPSALQARPCAGVNEALQVMAEIVRLQSGGDSAYFEGQRSRYSHTIGRITQLFPARCRVLDVGSHYLHQAGLLSLLGYRVSGIDLPLFAQAEFVKHRSETLNVDNMSVSDLESGRFLVGYEKKFDLILFTEILEHITFNPVAYWRRVYDLLADNGAIYLTTPNSLRPGAFLKAAVRLATLKGIGLSVDGILGNVTYGHHWKEYSSSEIREYFTALSSDFEVRINLYSNLPDRSWRALVSKALGILPVFRSDIEAIISVSGKTAFAATSPELPITQG